MSPENQLYEYLSFFFIIDNILHIISHYFGGG